MLILHVELENIKSYATARVAFTPGVNAIVGPNGAGKSTILEAIGFALFDYLPYRQSDFIREGERTGTVNVTFSSTYDERVYRVTRRVGGSNAYLVYDEELQAKITEGRADVLAFVRKHIGADPGLDLGRLFSYAIGVAQGTFTAAFLEQPSLRKPVFDGLLQVDEYRAVGDRLLQPVNLLKSRRQEIELVVRELTTRLERLPQLEQALAQRAAEMAAFALELDAVTLQLQAVNAEQARLEALRAELERLTVADAQLREQASATASQLDQAQAALAEAESAERAVDANAAGHAAYLAAQEQRHALEAQAQQRQQLLARQTEIERSIARDTASLQHWEDQLARVAAAEAVIVELAPAVARQAELEQALQIARQAAGQAASLERRIEHGRLQSTELAARARQLAAQLAEAEQERILLADAERSIGGLRADLESLRGQLSAQKVEAEAAKKQSAALQDVAAAICPLCEQPLTSSHREEMLQRNNQRLQDLRSQYAQIQVELRRGEAALAAAEQEQRQLQQRLLALPRPQELAAAAAQQQEVEREVSSLEAELQGLLGAVQQERALADALAVLGNPRQRSAVAGEQAGQRRQLEQQHALLAEQLATTRAQAADCQQQLARFADLDANLGAADEGLATHAAAYHAVLGNRLLAATRQRRADEVETLRRRRHDCQRQQAEIETALRHVRSQFDPSQFTSILSEGQNLRARSSSLDTQLAMQRKQQENDEDERTSLVAQRSRLAALVSQQQRWGAQESALENIRGVLRQAGPYITQAVIRQVSSGAAQVFGELMRDYSRQLRWNEDYGITLEVDGRVRQFAQLSGGEQMSAALAVRLALVRELSSVDLAFFDEPTANLDDARREALARQIMGIRGFRQLFVISHDDTFEQITQNLIRVTRHGNASVVEFENLQLG